MNARGTSSRPSANRRNAFTGFSFVAVIASEYTLYGSRWSRHGNGPITPFKEDGNWKWPLDFSPDGKAVLSIRDNRLVLWELATGREIRQFERLHSERPGNGFDLFPKSAHFTPDGKNVVSGDSDLSLRRWDVATGRQVGVARIPDPVIERYADAEFIESGGHIRENASFRFSSNGRFALSIIGSDIYYPPGLPPREWDSESVDSRLVLWDTVKLKALGPAVRKQIIPPLDPRIR